MYLLSQSKILLLLFITILCDEINEKDPMQYSRSTLVSIRYDCQYKNDLLTHCCSGTILTESYILTSADCVDGWPSDITIAAGIQSPFEFKQVIRKIDQIIIHPNWTNELYGLKHNIALLHLLSPLDFTVDKHITRISSPIPSDLSKGILEHPSNTARLLALGLNSANKRFDGTTSISLQQTEASLVDSSDPICNELVSDVEQQFCARLHHDSRDSCNRKSGEPILQWSGKHWMQVGTTGLVVEESNGSCLGVYMRLAYYHQWIQSVVMFDSLTSSVITNPSTFYKCNAYTTLCGCSTENVELSSTRIVGGEEAIPRSWTMSVSIRLNDSEEHSCGGSILTGSYILTSAYCVDGASAMDISIAAGMHNRIEDFALIRYVTDIYIHPNWNKSDGTFRNDIAILRIFPPLPAGFNGNYALTCVPYISFPNEIVTYPQNGSRLVTIGWGLTQYGNNNMSDTLQQASGYVIDNNDAICLQSIHDAETQFCAGIYGDPCQGDSGSPIFQWKDTYWEQVGITSFGGQCNRIGSLSIFTRLIYYFDWIESVINASLTTTTPKLPPIPTPYICNKTASCGCGKINAALTPSRVVGGENAIEHSWPMMVSLRFSGSKDHSCGGTILSNSYILTAAHCLRRIFTEYPTGITIAAGMTNRSDPLQIIRNVDRMYMHPNYTSIPNDFRHDIALLHIDEPFVFDSNSYLSKTCIHRIDPPLLTNQYPKNGTRLVVIGWGVLRFGTMYLPEILQQAEVFTIDNQDLTCVNYTDNAELQFCAGLYEGGKDSCQGDSGGPIFQWTGQYWEQVGIVSNGVGCAAPGFPGIYTRLSYYYNWIEDILKLDGEHLEPDILSYATTMKPSTTSTSEIHPSATSSYRLLSTTSTISYWSASSTTKTVMRNDVPKYEFIMLIFGPLIFLFLL